jgi:hypothetical protein
MKLITKLLFCGLCLADDLVGSDSDPWFKLGLNHKDLLIEKKDQGLGLKVVLLAIF